jgi:uncharacterized membrane protein YeaQ/YmgE (transglycosylase-associated protein family)
VILVWLFGLLFGLLGAVYAEFLLGYGILGSLLFGLAGAYAGWLLGVIVFSALRGAEDPGGPPA